MIDAARRIMYTAKKHVTYASRRSSVRDPMPSDGMNADYGERINHIFVGHSHTRYRW